MEKQFTYTLKRIILIPLNLFLKGERLLRKVEIKPLRNIATS
jgi:hypothetical protein